MIQQEIENFSKSKNINFSYNYNLKKLNWFNIGGFAKIFYKPESLEQLITFLKEFGNKTNILVLGAGSNILLNDNTFDGVVIKLGKKFSNISLMPNNIIVAGAATSGFKHYYQRFAEEEDMNDGTVTQVEIVSDKTKKTRGRK